MPLDGNTHYTLSMDKKRLLERQGIKSGFTFTMSCTTLLFMVLVVVAAVAAVVVYRMAVTEALSFTLTFSYASTVATITGICEPSGLLCVSERTTVQYGI